MKNIQLTLKIFALGLTLTMLSCSKSEEVSPTPPTSDDLSFTYTVDPENPNLIHFTGQTTAETWYIHWNFGDNTGEEGLDASKVFFKKGEYDVRFKIFTEGGTAFVTQKVSIESDFQGPDLVKNGSLDGADFWNVLEISGGATVIFKDGSATWTGGAWGHVGIYQLIEVEADKEYQINMDVSGSGMSDCWFEVYVGQAVPQAGVDYTDGGIRLGLNTWDGCGGEAFEGQLTDIACVGDGGSFSWAASGSAYIVIRSGGVDLGAEGVSIDNVAIRSL